MHHTSRVSHSSCDGVVDVHFVSAGAVIGPGVGVGESVVVVVVVAADAGVGLRIVPSRYPLAPRTRHAMRIVSRHSG